MDLLLKSIGERLYLYLKFKKIGVNEFAKMIQTSGAQISNIINGKNYGTIKLLAVINACPDLNLIWLVQGKGEMINHSNSVDLTSKTYYSIENFDEILNENERLKIELDKSLLQNRSLESAISYQNLTIEAYKNSLEIASSSNKDLKQIIEFYKSIAEDILNIKKLA